MQLLQRISVAAHAPAGFPLRRFAAEGGLHLREALAAERGLQLLHTIAMHLPVGVPRKIDWLCQPGTLKRWQAIRETLKRMGAERNLREHTIARYSDQQPSDPNRN